MEHTEANVYLHRKWRSGVLILITLEILNCSFPVYFVQGSNLIHFYSLYAILGSQRFKIAQLIGPKNLKSKHFVVIDEEIVVFLEVDEN